MGLHGRKNAVLHNAVDVHLFMPSPIKRENKPFTILSVGRLVPMKGFHILLSAVAQLNQSLAQPAHLILVGDGPQKEELLQKAEVLGLRDKLKIVAPMPQEQLVAYYQQADVFCLPSFSEGLPCVVVEAMACGKPVVATRVGGIPELVDEKTGILVPPGDPKSLCEALVQASGMKVYARKRTKCGTTMQCTWSAVGKPRCHEELVSRLLAHPGVEELEL